MLWLVNCKDHSTIYQLERLWGWDWVTSSVQFLPVCLSRVMQVMLILIKAQPPANVWEIKESTLLPDGVGRNIERERVCVN